MNSDRPPSDSSTAAAYAKLAQKYSDEWLAQPAPTDMYALWEKYLRRGGSTADIGCGNGRDAAWLAAHGFPTTGYDASPELVAIARRLYPEVAFAEARLPALAQLAEAFANVVCETVIMHLPREQIASACAALRRVLAPDGVLYLSWRVTESRDARHADGRLYAAFSPDFVREQFRGLSTLHFEDVISGSSGKRVCRLIVRKD